eukprot:1147374-Pelagomonas_calceolata.AAC.7
MFARDLRASLTAEDAAGSNVLVICSVLGQEYAWSKCDAEGVERNRCLLLRMHCSAGCNAEGAA